MLKGAGLLESWKPKPSLKGTGFVQPLAPHEHWHVDVSYINICGTFFYLCSLLDGCSRAIVHWELREGRPGVPLSLQDARRLVSGFVQHYNTVRLHSAIGYITPAEGQRKRNGVHKSSQAPSLERFGVSRPERATFFTLANDERTSTRVLHYSYGANSIV